MTRSCLPPVPLLRLNFPPYVALVLSERHVLVAGGGGSSKTGVANKLEIFEINRTSSQADRISSVDTASTALMNGTAFEFEDQTFVAAGGIGGICQIFKTELSVDCDIRMNGIQRNGSPEPHHSSMRLRRRNSSSSSRDSVSNGQVTTAPLIDEVRRLTYNVKPFESFKCDFNENGDSKIDESFLKAVKFCTKSNVLITGGSDGHVRFWHFPTLRNTIDIVAHADEIVDLDVDFVGESMVSIARDGRCSHWRMKTGCKINDLEYVIPVAKNAMRPIKYKFKGCRFLPAPEAPQVLFTTLVPATWTKTPEPCFLCRWDVRKCLNDRRIVVGTDPSTHMSIRSALSSYSFSPRLLLFFCVCVATSVLTVVAWHWEH